MDRCSSRKHWLDMIFSGEHIPSNAYTRSATLWAIDHPRIAYIEQQDLHIPPLLKVVDPQS